VTISIAIVVKMEEAMFILAKALGTHASHLYN